MGNIFFCNCFGAYSCLNCHKKQMRRDGFFYLLADRFREFICFFLMNKKSESIDWVIHDVDNYLHDICLFKITVFVFKWSIAMSKRLYLIYKINDDLSERQFIFEHCLAVRCNFLDETSPPALAKKFNIFYILMRNNNCAKGHWL